MMLWVREIAGWLLIGIALYLVRLAVLFVIDLEAPRITEGTVLVLASFGILRTGLHLIRLATAARLCAKG